MGQDPFYIHYSTDNGLPSSTVYSIHQDEKGLMWFTTDAGIARYDSHDFKIYNSDDGLSDNEVFQMKKDFKGRQWLLTLNGKPSFFFENKIYNYSNSAFIRKIAGSGIIVDYYEDNENNLCFIFRNGEMTIVSPNDKVQKSSIANVTYYGGWKYKTDRFLLTGLGIYNSNTGLIVKEIERGNYYKVYHFEGKDYYNQSNILYEIKEGIRFNKIVELPEHTEILHIYFESNNKLWVCTRNGLFLYEKGVLKTFFFSGYTISNFVKDFEGGYWVATLKNGVLYVPSFDVFVDNPGLVENTKINCVSINHKKEIWLGSDKNDYYIKKGGQPFLRQTFKTNNRLDEIRNIRFFNNNTYVVGKVGVYKINDQGKVTYCGFGANDILISDSNFFIGYTYAHKVPSIKIEDEYLSRFNDYIFINKRVSVFEKGEQGDIWVGTNYGLYQYTSKGEISFWGNNSEQLQTAINDLYYDVQSKTLIIATSSVGILTIKNNKISNHIYIKDGLNSIGGKTIKKIADNSYLIGSNNGLNVLLVNNDSFNIKNVNVILGLRNSKINDIDFMNDTVYLATDKGLIFFNIKNIDQKKGASKCLIENFKNQGKIVSYNDSHQFVYDSNDVSISFTGISYINPNTLTYYYKLNGKGDEWSSTKESQINYKSLAPGNYIFSVYCINEFGIKSNIDSVSFEILTPYWKTTWFLLVGLLLVSAGIFLLIKYLLKQQKKRFEKVRLAIQHERDKATLEKQMIALEQKALRLQMNPHFIFNALNTIKGYYAEGDPINASTYISRFSKLLRMLLENTDQSIPLYNEIEMLELYIELTKIRYKNKFESKIIVDEHLNRNEIMIPTLLLQPIVENAIIHGLAPKKEVSLLLVSFMKKGNQLECIVEDNGIGRDASAQRQREYESKAIEITTERIALFSQENTSSSFEIVDLKNNHLPTGTKVIINIPLISIWQ